MGSPFQVHVNLQERNPHIFLQHFPNELLYNSCTPLRGGSFWVFHATVDGGNLAPPDIITLCRRNGHVLGILTGARLSPSTRGALNPKPKP